MSRLFNYKEAIGLLLLASDIEEVYYDLGDYFGEYTEQSYMIFNIKKGSNYNRRSDNTAYYIGEEYVGYWRTELPLDKTIIGHDTLGSRLITLRWVKCDGFGKV